MRHLLLLLLAAAPAAATGVLPARPIAASVERRRLYKFAGSDAERAEAVDRFERIDDVIMGGVSKSMLVEGDGCASWRGLVRTEGGGFCGQRTRAFATPLNASGQDGLYILSRLASDDEPGRRVWKLSLRTREGRGEVVYQAPFQPSAGADPTEVFVPFTDFQLVRGPVAVPGAPRISSVDELYQLGFTCSKFIIGPSMMGLDNFRNGSFQLDIHELGLYADRPAQGAQDEVEGAYTAPDALSPQEAQRSRPLMERVLTPVFRSVFSETKRRRKRAGQLLKERGATRAQMVRMGWSLKRLRGQSLPSAALQTAGQGVSAALSGSLLLLLKLLVFPVFRLAMRKQRRKEETGLVPDDQVGKRIEE